MTLRPQRPDFLAEAVAFGLQALKVGFYGTPPGIGRKNSLDDVVHSRTRVWQGELSQNLADRGEGGYRA